MIKSFKNYQVELSGSIVYIRGNDGELLKAREVNANEAVSKFNEICAIVAKKDS
jgi:hypothetical protein